MKYLLSLILFFASASGFSAKPVKSHIALDFGAYATHLENRFTAPDGLASEVSALSGWFRFRPCLSIGKRFFFEPSLGLAVPWRSGADGSSRVFTIQLDLDLRIPLLSFLSVRVGPGAQSLLYLNSGGAVELQNGGASLTSTYYVPSGAVMTFSFTTQLGLHIEFSSRFSLNLDAILLEALDVTRRSLSGAVTVGVAL